MTISGKTLGDCTIVVEDADVEDDVDGGGDERVRPLVGSQTCVTRETFQLGDGSLHLKKLLELTEEANQGVFDGDVTLFLQNVSSKLRDFLICYLLVRQKPRAMVMSSLDFPLSLVD